ncbi:MAG TPA: right-handed parallel beta-helix repeat-containing protein, partial [Bacteroidetes bacterium]|nr:right-handed parallel beta-helix repeat-containing protein [Bacteroidota bacterium]
MKRTALTTIALLLFSLLTAQTTYYVSLTGNDSNTGLSQGQAWRTITYAASLSSPVTAGDTVFIKAGNYGNENIAFEKSGTASQNITFAGYQAIPGDQPLLNYTFGDGLNSALMPLLDAGNRATAGTAITLYSQKYITIKNIQITHYQTGVDGWDASHNTLENMIALSMGNFNAAYSGKGFRFSPNGNGDNGDNNTMINCIVSNACAEGISVMGDNNYLEGCKIYCDEDTTVYASMDYYIVIAGDSNHLKGCYIERFGDLEHGGAGIGLKEFGEHNLIEDCTAKNLENGGFYVRWAGVKNNEFRNCKAIGTLADVNGFLIRDGASYNEFNGCTVENCSAAISFAVSGEDSSYCGSHNVFNNCIVRNATWAIGFSSWAIPGPADSNLFVNCVFFDADYLFRVNRENHDNKMINCIVADVNTLFTGSTTLNFEYVYSDFYNNGFAMP